MKRAVIVGKFHPPHKGHHYLINTAIAETDKVYVLVCDNNEFTLDAKTRATWLKQIHPKAIIKIIPDIKKDSNSKAWAKHTINFLGFKPDVAYTSEEYGKTWTKEMGCEHRLLDLNRSTIPISATKIRQNPIARWDFMQPQVRQAFCKRAVVLGAESTGTTTLTQNLAEYYNCPFSVELGRDYSHSIKFANHQWDNYDFVQIAKMQQEYEDTMAGISDGLIICDTNAFATMLWEERYTGEISPALRNLGDSSTADLYILTGDEIAFEQDGLRDGEHIRHQMQQRFKQELTDAKAIWIEVSGTEEDRLKKAVKEIDKLPQKEMKLYAKS